MSKPSLTEPQVTFVPLSEWVERPVAWLWPGRLALGKLAILDGDPGLGKSLVSLHLCACVTGGRPFPDGSPAPEPGYAIVLNAEDGVEDTIKPRLRALGGDAGRVHLPRPEDGEGGLLRLPSGLETLDKAVARTQARLVVIDPIMAFLDRGINIANDHSVRRALYPLASLAARRQCAVLLIRHLNKTAGAQALYRGNASIGFVGACRSAWLVGRDPEDEARCVLAQVKNNLGPAQPSLAYSLTPQGEGPPLLTWLGTTPLHAGALVGSRSMPLPKPSRREQAREALEEFLLEKPHTSREIWEFAVQRKISTATLRRAKKELRIRTQRVWKDKTNQLSYWLLPGQELPADRDDPYDLEPWLKPLREKYPPSTPIDDM